MSQKSHIHTGLNSYKKIIYSQWGEDGVIEEIFKRIGTKNKFCVEFGAGNGSESSNVWNLIKNNGWQALLMDSNTSCYQKWTELLKDSPKSKILNVLIGISGDNSLENILKRNNVPLDLDLLSIDIDSNDHHIFKSMKLYKPRVLIIEHNPTIPPEDTIVQNQDSDESFGASAKANVELAHEKGYVLVSATCTNCLYVSKEEFGKLTLEEPVLIDVFDTSKLSYIISGYNGSLYIKNQHKNYYPTYGWLYKAYNVSLLKNSLRVFTFGASLNKSYSKTLAEKYQPIKVLHDYSKNTGGLLYFIISLFKISSKEK